MYLFVYWITNGKLTFWQNFWIVFVASLFIPICDITQDVYVTQNFLVNQNIDLDIQLKAYLKQNPHMINNPEVRKLIKGIKQNQSILNRENNISKKDPSLFMWANNPSKPECCVSGMGNTYYTSHGCICYTDEQLKQLSNRGNNMDNSCRSYI
jgi:hypothetical protein